ncbi:ubiquitin-like domain-containing protein [Virgibacillus flavescens]|uniref:ubiquitin-like domain-containing protein n=1 Tax=Virgibacillus flavescens TaxID=1611422 RepID=UPI003D330C88
MKIISKLLPASKMKLVISSIGVLALVIFSTLVVMEATKTQVVVMNNGEKETVTTHANTVDEVLKEVGIVVGQHDAISHTGDTKIKDNMQITYKQSTQVLVTIDGQEKAFHTFAATIGEFLEDNNLSLTKHDEVSHKADDKIVDGLKLKIDKGFQVAVNDGGNEKKLWTTGGTVEQLLDNNKIKLSESDKLNVDLKEQVSSENPINIVRVEKAEVEVEEAVAFKTEQKEDGSLTKGEKRVVSEGKKGTVIKTYEVVKENGKEVSRKLIGEEVKEDSESRVVAIGTKVERTDLVTLASTQKKESAPAPAPEPRPEPKKEKRSGNVLYMHASAYTASCAGCSGYTATGINLNANPNAKVIAVDPSVIPLGTRVYIEGYGEYVAADTGGSIHGNRIDIHFSSKSAAYAFGRKTVKVTILN